MYSSYEDWKLSMLTHIKSEKFRTKKISSFHVHCDILILHIFICIHNINHSVTKYCKISWTLCEALSAALSRIKSVSLSAIGDPRGGIVCGTRQVKASCNRAGPRDTVPGPMQSVRGELGAGMPSAVHRELSASWASPNQARDNCVPCDPVCKG